MASLTSPPGGGWLNEYLPDEEVMDLIIMLTGSSTIWSPHRSVYHRKQLISRLAIKHDSNLLPKSGIWGRKTTYHPEESVRKFKDKITSLTAVWQSAPIGGFVLETAADHGPVQCAYLIAAPGRAGSNGFSTVPGETASITIRWILASVEITEVLQHITDGV